MKPSDSHVLLKEDKHEPLKLPRNKYPMFNIQLLKNRDTRFVIMSLTLGAMMLSFLSAQPGQAGIEY
jgi:hypothetical protein